MTRKDEIAEVLNDIYGTTKTVSKRSMVYGLALEVDAKLDRIYDEYGPNRRVQELTKIIWIWFSGGDTAQIAAEHILEKIGD